MQKLLVLSLLVLMALAIIPAQAQTITMANPGGIASRDIIVYWPNGSMIGLYNSTSVIELENTSDYIFAMRPLRTNLLEDPGDWMTNTAFPFISTNAVPIILALFGIGLITRRG